MKAPFRVYRTVEGRLVPEGHPEAAFLEFPAGADLPNVVAAALGLKQAEPLEDKQAAKPEDKARRRPRSRSRKG